MQNSKLHHRDVLGYALSSMLAAGLLVVATAAHAQAGGITAGGSIGGSTGIGTGRLGTTNTPPIGPNTSTAVERGVGGAGGVGGVGSSGANLSGFPSTTTSTMFR